MRQSWMLSREGGWEAVVTSGDAEYGMMNMGVGVFADRRAIYRYTHLIISSYELDAMCPLSFP